MAIDDGDGQAALLMMVKAGRTGRCAAVTGGQVALAMAVDDREGQVALAAAPLSLEGRSHCAAAVLSLLMTAKGRSQCAEV